MCYTPCDECKSCKNVEYSTDECQYTQTPPPITTILNLSDNECPDKLSITTLIFWIKNYNLYGFGAMAVVVLYVLFMIISIRTYSVQSLISSAVILYLEMLWYHLFVHIVLLNHINITSMIITLMIFHLNVIKTHWVKI